MQRFLDRRWVVGVTAGALVGAVVIGLGGCQNQKEAPPTTPAEGADPSSSPVREPAVGELSISALSEDSVGETVAVRGEVVQQCPAVGCWIRLRDETGELFVDLKPGSLELSEKRVGQQARISGRLVKQAGELQLEAEHLEFVSEDSPASDHE